MRGAAGVPAHDCSFKIPTVWPAERLRVGCRKRIPVGDTLHLDTLGATNHNGLPNNFFEACLRTSFGLKQKRPETRVVTNKKAAKGHCVTQKQDPIKPSVYAGL